jgi:hypothetical protein
MWDVNVHVHRDIGRAAQRRKGRQGNGKSGWSQESTSHIIGDLLRCSGVRRASLEHTCHSILICKLYPVILQNLASLFSAQQHQMSQPLRECSLCATLQERSRSLGTHSAHVSMTVGNQQSYDLCYERVVMNSLNFWISNCYNMAWALLGIFRIIISDSDFSHFPCFNLPFPLPLNCILIEFQSL